MDAISEVIRCEVPRDMLYAGDLIVAEDTPSHLQARLIAWQKALESKGFKINSTKRKTMVFLKTHEPLVITDSNGNVMKQLESFRYLESMVNATGGCEKVVKHRIKAAWQKWKDLLGVVCDQIPIRVKGKVYKTMIRPVLIYGAEAWSLRRKDEEMLERTEMRMLRWILGISLKNKKRNEDICRLLGVACITDKVREARLRWYGHVERREDHSFFEEL